MEMFLGIVVLLITALTTYYLILKPVYLYFKFKYAPDYIVVKNTYGDGSVTYHIKKKLYRSYSYTACVTYQTEQEAKDEIAKMIKRDLSWSILKSEVIK